MNTACIAIIGAITTILAAFGGAALGAYFAYKTGMKLVQATHKNAIASKFKATVIYELTGFYPIVNLWDKNEFPRLYQSIPKINSAAAEFRYFVTREADFDKAISEYNSYCRDTKESDAFGFDYKDMGSKTTKDHQNDFINIVEHLISFANEK